MKLETERLIIRELKPSDEKPFAAMAADGSLEDIGFDANVGEWLSGWITEAAALTEKDDPTAEYLAYAIELKGTGTVIGSVGCSYYEDMAKVGITYFIGAEYRNRGYASEAVKAYAEHFLRRYDISELIATVREENVPSRRVIERCGFSLTERKIYKDINDDKAEMYRFYTMTNQREERP